MPKKFNSFGCYHKHINFRLVLVVLRISKSFFVDLPLLLKYYIYICRDQTATARTSCTRLNRSFTVVTIAVLGLPARTPVLSPSITIPVNLTYGIRGVWFFGAHFDTHR